MGREAAQRGMASPCIGEASKACLSDCCTCASPFVLSRGPPEPLPESATARLDDFKWSTFSSLPHPNTDFTNHESLPSLHESCSIFENAYPQFSLTKRADEIRAQDYPHLTRTGHVCLDYVGHGLFTRTSTPSSSTSPQLDSRSGNRFFDIICRSVTLSSQLLSDWEEAEFESKIRKRIFGFMNVSEDDYAMVLTANKSSAFRLLAETYPFNSNRNLVAVYDHESEAVETMIEHAAKRGAVCKSAVFSWPSLRINSEKLRYLVETKKKNKGLFVFPLQSGLTGARYSYLWMSLASEKGWNVLLDASALGAKDMETLGLSLFHPDFLFCSFYKVFGENPSGFGCLFIKRSSGSILNESNVGIVSLVPPQGQGSDPEVPEQEPPEGADEKSDSLESDEPNKALEELEFRGLDNADSLGLIVISNRAKYLVNWLVNALLSLKHPNSEDGLALVRIYGPKVQINRGPALAFNVFDWKGEKVDPELVQKLADRSNISLSFGFLKRIGFSDKYRGERGKLLEKRSSGVKGELGSGVHVLNASFGWLTNFEDVYRLWAFVSRFLDADFVEKERWRYMALNQKTIEI